MSPISNKNGKDIGQPPGRPPGSTCDADENYYDELVPFDPSRYPDGANGAMYMRPPLSPPRNRTHDRKHQKKKSSRSRSTNPNKLNLISPLPDFQLNSLHHLLKYDMIQSRADKSSAGSNHTSIHKHHLVCHLNPTSATRRLDATIKKKRGGVVDSAVVSSVPVVSSAKSISKSCKRSPTLPIQQAYSAQVKKEKRNELFDLLEKIPEAKAIRESNLSKFDSDGNWKPIHSSVFFNPFKFKRGRRREPKNNQHTKKKVKDRAQPLGLHDQQICKYHHPIVYPPTYPGDEPVMAFTVDPIPVSPSKITSVPPSLVTISIDEPEQIPNEEAKLEKLVASSDSDLDEVIKFCSLCSVMIPETFLSCGISTADFVADNPVYHDRA